MIDNRRDNIPAMSGQLRPESAGSFTGMRMRKKLDRQTAVRINDLNGSLYKIVIPMK
jgi:hypothetical protein